MALPTTREQPNLLFVYGLLRRGMSAALGQFVAGAAKYVAEATTTGTLYSVDDAYPGLVLGGAGFGASRSEVHGELWRIEREEAFVVLDAFEGVGPGQPEPQPYRRGVILVDSVGVQVAAFAYIYQLAIDELPRVLSGDWARR